MALALFDFDGTISTRDSFLAFLWFSSRSRFLVTLSWRFFHVARYLAKKFPNSQLKEEFLCGIVKGMAIGQFRRQAAIFCEAAIPAMIRPQFWETLQHHQKQRDKIVIITATPREILEPWCEQHELEILGTELELDRECRITGKIAGLNCMGEEKVRKIKEFYNIPTPEEIFAYGDSDSDLPMLALAAPPNRFFKPFRTPGPSVPR